MFLNRGYHKRPHISLTFPVCPFGYFCKDGMPFTCPVNKVAVPTGCIEVCFENVHEYVSYLVILWGILKNNLYIHNGDLTFHQMVGLPMGTKAAPLLAPWVVSPRKGLCLESPGQ